MPYRMTNLDDSWICVMPSSVTPLTHIIHSRYLPYYIADIKRVVSICQICCECKRNFIGPTRETLSKPCSRLKGSIFILRVLFLVTIKINIFWMLLMNTLGSHSYFRVVTYQLRASLRHWHRCSASMVCRLSSIPTRSLFHESRSFQLQ